MSRITHQHRTTPGGCILRSNLSTQSNIQVCMRLVSPAPQKPSTTATTTTQSLNKPAASSGPCLTTRHS